MRSSVLLMLLATLSAHAALITDHTDSVISSPVLDGVISPNEYGPGNAYAYTGTGTGFGGQFGGATLYAKSDAVYLYLAFANLGIPVDGNQGLLYLDTIPGGFQPDGIAMDDTLDGGRRNATLLSLTGRETVTFNDGTSRSPDFALVVNNRAAEGFSALYGLKPAGSAHDLITHDRSALGVTNVEFRIPLASIGLTDGETVNFAGFCISDTAYLSSEGIPGIGLSSNIGFAAGQTNIFPDFHRFTTYDFSVYQGVGTRRPNQTLRFPPVIPSPTTNSYTTTNAFPGVVFTNPIAIATAPGDTNRLYVVERAGRVVVITNLASPSRTVFLNLPGVNASGEGGLLDIAFHPNYASNRQFYAFYTRTATNGSGTGFHTRVSGFLRTATNENLALASTEVVLYSQFNNQDNHNGGTIAFGPDGYLYVGTGDEGGGNDNWNNSQIIDKDFFSAMMRIDVDKKPGSLAPNPHPALGGVTNYAIPPDNPFIGITNYYGSNVVPNRVRTEFYATGLRNPFRFSFDPLTARLYVADVGQNAWEEINLVTNGGNYGWAAREGYVAGPKSGFPATNYANPVLVYGRGSATNQGTSVTGGRVYRGDRFPELVGRYIFADYQSGHIWAMSHNGITNTAFSWLATDANITGFGADPRNGDLLLADLVQSQVKRLVYGTVATNALPANLADTGIFADLATLTPFEGIVPYAINVPFWSDNALKRRWFSIPDTNRFITFNPDGAWTAPSGTVWVKHFDLETTSGVPASIRRIETRVLVKNDSSSGGYGITYRWGTSTSNAVLVAAAGLDEPILINDSGIIRTQIWRYPSRGACLTCHNQAAGFTLSFTTPQMNMVHDFGDLTTNQIAALRDAGYFSSAVSNLHLLRRLAHPTNTEFSVSYRARSWLQANCAACHLPGGPVPSTFDARITTPISLSGIFDAPLANDFGDPENRVIKPGLVPWSMALTRISTLESGRMPPLGSTVLDTQSIALVTAWITGELATYESRADWRARHFGDPNAPEAQPGQDPDLDGLANEAEYLAGTQPTNAMSTWEFTTFTEGDPHPSLLVNIPAQAGVDIQVTTSLVDAAWFSLDVPANAPVHRASDATVPFADPDTTNHLERYYRARVYEP